MGEIGDLPSPKVLSEQPRWVWFLSRAEHLGKDNTPEAIRATFDDPRVLGRDEVRARKTVRAGAKRRSQAARSRR